MSSLYQIVRRGGSSYEKPAHPNFGSPSLLSLIDDVKKSRYEMIRYDEMYEQSGDDLFHGKWIQLSSPVGSKLKWFYSGKLDPLFDKQIPVRPPFNRVWMESACLDGKMATQVAIVKPEAGELHKQPLIMFAFWRFAQNHCFILFAISSRLNDDGTMDVDSLSEGAQFDDLAIGADRAGILDGCRLLAEQQFIDTLKILQLLNCKNVELRTAGISKTKPSKGKGNETNKGIEWKTLFISAPGKTANASPSSGETCMTRSHVVRGHFADYRNGAGLFGKYKGLFWVTPHVKGNPEIGAINKQYAIKAGSDRLI